MRGGVGDKPKDDKWWQDDYTFLDMICGLTPVQAQPDPDHRHQQHQLRGGRVAKKWQNMTREGRAWCPPKLMTSWYEQPLMRLQLNTKLTCINLSSSFPLIHWNISKLGSWASRIIYFCENTHCLRIKNSQHLISTFIIKAQFLERIETPALILNRHHHKTGLNFFCI